jgi:hypothetical protein
MTTEQIRIRLTTDELKELQNLAESCELSMTALSGIFVKAALRAIQANHGRLALPLQLKVEDPKTRK